MMIFISEYHSQPPSTVEQGYTEHVKGFGAHALNRTVLLFFVIVCLGGAFFLEQPGSSLMHEYHRFRFLCTKLRVPELQHSIYKQVEVQFLRSQCV